MFCCSVIITRAGMFCLAGFWRNQFGSNPAAKMVRIFVTFSGHLIGIKCLYLLSQRCFYTREQYYKTFYKRNLWMGQTSWSLCPWQAFPTWSSICRCSMESTPNGERQSTRTDSGLPCKHWTRLERIAKNKHSSLLGPFVN